MKKSTLSLSLAVGLALFLSSAVKAQASMPFNFVGGAGKTPGTVNLTWSDLSNQANGYSLMYGTAAGSYTWGVPSISEYGQNSSFTVGYLTPGQTYYFLLTAYNGNTFVASSGPIAVMATGGTVAVSAPVVSTVSVPTSAPTGMGGPVSRYGFRATTGSQTGTVDLWWIDDTTASAYDIAYGKASGQYQWGLQNMPHTPNVLNKYTVGFLQSGVTYYFVLNPENGGQSVQGFTSVVAAVAR